MLVKNFFNYFEVAVCSVVGLQKILYFLDVPIPPPARLFLPFKFYVIVNFRALAHIYSDVL